MPKNCDEIEILAQNELLEPASSRILSEWQNEIMCVRGRKSIENRTSDFKSISVAFIYDPDLIKSKSILKSGSNANEVEKIYTNSGICPSIMCVLGKTGI